VKKTEKDIAQAKKDLEKLTGLAKDTAIKENEYAFIRVRVGLGLVLGE